MKYTNITLSFPEDLNALLHCRVNRREINKYVVEALKKALQEDEKKELIQLEAAYEEANRDADRLETIADWESLDNSDEAEG